MAAPKGVVHNGMPLAWLAPRVLSLKERVRHGELKVYIPRHPGCGARADRSRLVDHRTPHHRHAARFHGARRLRRDARQRCLATRPCGEADRGGAGGGARAGHARGAHPRRPSARSVRCAAGKDRARRAEPSHRRSRPDGTDPDPWRGRPRHHSRAVSAGQRSRNRQTGQGRVLRDRTRRYLAEIRHRKSSGVRRHHRGLCQHHGARGQRPRLSLRRAGRWLRLLFPRIPRDGPEDDQGPGWHLRLGQRFSRGSQRNDTGDLKQSGSGSITMSTSTTGTAAKSDFKPVLWTPGDWNAFFGFGTNILVNMLVLTGLLRFVLKMPDSLVFGRILPALGLMMCLSTFYYAWLAYRLAQKTGRSDVCALPSGVSVPHMFIVTFVIMLPITIKTGDPMKGWSAGLVWVFFQSFILMIGGFIAPYIRKITPRAALLGTLAGVSVTFISMRPALEMYMTPQIGLDCFAIILVSWFGGVKYPKGIPAGLVAIAVGMLIAWGSNLFGLGLGGLSIDKLAGAVAGFGFSVPVPAFGTVFSGFEFLGVILVTAIPFGIYDLVEAMDNVESAEAAGDAYPTTSVLTADGVVSLIGCLMGNPFINAVYIGHPGWKAMGGRIGYSAATGLMVILLAWFGVIAVLLAFIPVVAISPILLYIGMLIGAQAYQTTPSRHAPAVVLALTPHLAAWCKTLMDGALGAAGTSAAAIGMDKLGNVGVLYEGLSVMGGGAILSGLVLAAIGVFVVEKKFVEAAAFALAGAILTFFGFMHGESVGIAVTPVLAVAYLIVAIFLFGLSRAPASSLDKT